VYNTAFTPLKLSILMHVYRRYYIAQLRH
jgi:hypothetical protein